MSIGLAAAFCLPRWGLVDGFLRDVLPDVILDVLDFSGPVADVCARCCLAAALAAFF